MKEKRIEIFDGVVVLHYLPGCDPEFAEDYDEFYDINGNNFFANVTKEDARLYLMEGRRLVIGPRAPLHGLNGELISNTDERYVGLYVINDHTINEVINNFIEMIKNESLIEYLKSDTTPLLAINGIEQKEWCRKAKYEVQIELGCYQIDEEHPLLPGFEEKEFDGVKYAIKSGTNDLEQNSWKTNPDRPYIITGTVGERWPVKPSNLSAYEVNSEDITISPLTISTKNPDDQEFMSCLRVPLKYTVKVVTKWAFKEDGSIDESQVLVTNSADSRIDHADGDYIVAKYIPGEPEYFELPEEVRNTKEMAAKYSPRVINGSVMETTYDHAASKYEILEKYKPHKKRKLQ